jgi:hypothetical protein
MEKVSELAGAMSRRLSVSGPQSASDVPDGFDQIPERLPLVLMLQTVARLGQTPLGAVNVLSRVQLDGMVGRTIQPLVVACNLRGAFRKLVNHNRDMVVF